MANSVVNIFIDARNLQDDNFKERGVGRHSANLLKYARDHLAFFSIEAHLTAIVDRSMPALCPDHAGLFDSSRYTGYAAKVRPPHWFIELSPMTHDPLFVTKNLTKQDVFCATLVYDFIPLHQRGFYLSRPLAAVEYSLQMFWLSHYQLFFPISHSSAGDLRELLSVSSDRIFVTGAPIDASFELPSEAEIKPFQAGHILAVGGGDPRKNVELAVVAHAGNRELQQRRIGLVIVGHYSPAWQAALAASALAIGGDEKLIYFPGKVAQPVLTALYREAICVVVPSKAEGFSLPVVEAMASGTAAIASSIDAHRELIGRADLLFEPDDHVKVGNLLATMVSDRKFRADVVRDQKDVWPKFRGAEVARVFWAAMAEHAPRDAVRSPAISKKRKPKIAFLTPLPPSRSGVADYSAASIEEIGKIADLHIFTETDHPSPLSQAVSIRPLSPIPYLSNEFDRVVSVLGNSHFHLQNFNLVMKYGGSCIQHDNRLLGFYCALLSNERALSVAGDEIGRELGQAELDSWLGDESKLKALFLGELAAVAEPMFVHSGITASLIEQRHGTRPVHLPFSIYRNIPADYFAPTIRESSRAHLNIGPNEIAIVTFGFVHQSKAPEECIWAVELLRSWGIPATLHFVGQIDSNQHDVMGLASEIGVGQNVKIFRDFVTEEVYRHYLSAADFAIQLRTFGFGGLSGALLDCIAAGLPSVANEDLATAMEAPIYVARVPDHPSPVLIAEAIATMVGDGAHLHRWADERQEYYESHNLNLYARRLVSALGF